MANYDFSCLNPFEFQELVNDLFAALSKQPVERFKQGKDWGIDGRLVSEAHATTIIQAKHYHSSGVKTLIRHLRKCELEKIKNLNPQRYVLATSVGLSPKNKNEILAALNPYITSTKDVLGKDDLNALLKQFPAVEQSYVKLWLPQSSVIKTILNAKVFTAREQLLAKAAEDNKNFVSTSQYKRALSKLYSEHVLLLTGEPGIGKTTVAEQLCLEFAANGYEIVVILDSVDEAFSVLDPTKKQLFYFDDFLGSNFLEALRFNEDSKVMRFIETVKRNDSLRFVLTSRTSILDQAYNIGESFSRNGLNKQEHLLRIEDYSKFDKAMILYSFLWRSNISRDQLSAFVGSGMYERIIGHRNYNPRLLEFITSPDSIENRDAEAYLEYIDESLDNPHQIWRFPYERQLNDYSRAIVDLIALADGSLSEEALKAAYEKFLSLRGRDGFLSVKTDFYYLVNVLCRSFIKRIHQSTRSIVYKVFNPSISDYIIDYYKKRPEAWAKRCSLYDNYEGILFIRELCLDPVGDYYDDDYELFNKIILLLCKNIGYDLFNKNLFYVSIVAQLLDEEDFEDVFCEYKIDNIINYLNSALKHNEMMYSNKGICSEYNKYHFPYNDLVYIHFYEIDFISSLLSLNKCSSTQIAECTQLILDFPCWEVGYLSSVSFMLCGINLEPEARHAIHKTFYEKLYLMWEEEAFEEFFYNRKNYIIKHISVIDDKHKKKKENKRFIRVTYYNNKEYCVNVEAIAEMMSKEYYFHFATISKKDAAEFIRENDMTLLSFLVSLDRERELPHIDSNPDTNIDVLFSGLLQSKFPS